jgi:hypothetical protein
MSECVSCGLEANPESEREFCDECDAHFEAGEVHAQQVVERAEKLEQAKSEGNTELVGKIMAEIAMEAFEADVAAGNTTKKGK